MLPRTGWRFVRFDEGNDFARLRNIDRPKSPDPVGGEAPHGFRVRTTAAIGMAAVQSVGDEPAGDVTGERRRDRAGDAPLHEADEQPVMDDGREKADAEEGGG